MCFAVPFNISNFNFVRRAVIFSKCAFLLFAEIFYDFFFHFVDFLDFCFVLKALLPVA